MIFNDLINGLFEVVGALLLSMNVRQLLKDKTVRGVHWVPAVLFTVWGLWNLLYYPSLDWWFSFAGGVAIVAVNATWLALAIKYWSREKARGA